MTAAERQRAKRARDKAARILEQEEARRAPLRLALAAEAEAQLGAIEQALDDEHRGLPVAERLFEGAKSLVVKLYGHPLLRIAERAGTPAAQLAQQLGCTKLEAEELRHRADVELLDRLIGKAAPAKFDGGTPPVVVNLVATPGIRAHLEGEADQVVSVGVGA